MATPEQLMAGFAERTGVTGRRPQKRYLWTDAFAVCNFLGLGRSDLARSLIDRVHAQLGRHRTDDPRTGWISGATDEDGAAHPTRGGLRIGKPLIERDPGERMNDRLEWDRDGQYFHYLTKWMHALARTTRVTGDPAPLRWARELAEVAHDRFAYGPVGARRMYWKMSIDLSRPLVASMGHHDPLDGYVTCLALRAAGGDTPALAAAIADFRSMIEPDALATADALGLGGLLLDAHRLTQLDSDRSLRDAILDAVRRGLSHFVQQRELGLNAEHRLAFRELGLAIGLAAIEPTSVAGIRPFAHLRETITTFWIDPRHRGARAYREHEDINDVMLATALAPDGFLARHEHPVARR